MCSGLDAIWVEKLLCSNPSREATPNKTSRPGTPATSIQLGSSPPKVTPPPRTDLPFPLIVPADSATSIASIAEQPNTVSSPAPAASLTEAGMHPPNTPQKSTSNGVFLFPPLTLMSVCLHLQKPINPTR
jgi:hypothetical protein